MTGKQETKLTMYVGVDKQVMDNSTIVNQLPNFQFNYEKFKETIAAIQVTTGIQVFDKSGFGSEKDLYREELVRLVADTARKMMAFAVNQNNQVLLKEVDITESTLKRSRDTILKELAQGIFNRAQTYLPLLSDYGLNDANLEALKSAIAAYSEAIPKPRLSIAEQKQATLQLAKLFEEADTYLDKMDVLVEIVRTNQIGFYEAYRNARKLINVGVGTLALKGLVKEANTGEPVNGASLRFVLQNTSQSGKATEAFVKKTAAKGGINLKTLTEGMYEVTASKNGYKTRVVTVAVNASDTTEMLIELERN